MHYCPRCEMPCHCHGDVDDAVVETKRYSDERCTCACESEDEDEDE